MVAQLLEKLGNLAQSAFLEVGVFVGAVLLIFGFINYKTQGRFVQKLENAKKLQPFIGALLGLTPGCGGTIFVMPLYLKGSVTFGTVVSALIATMGDAAFVLISTRPIEYIIVSGISFLAAIATGYIVDALKIDGGFSKRRTDLLKRAAVPAEEHARLHSIPMRHIGHKDGDSVDMILHHNIKQGHEKDAAMRFTHNIAYRIFWALIGVGLILGIMLLADIDVNTALGIPNLGVYIGVAGIIFCVIYMIADKRVIKNEEHEVSELKLLSLKETMVHNAEDTAFVCIWVFVAYCVYELLVTIIGGELVIAGWMTATGLASVIVGALVGLVPGCGPQIIFVSLYTRGMLPFAALLTNSISQDGDALFPLLAIDRRSSFIATVITTIPALLFGIAAYYIEMLIIGAF
ncbi:MAG: putative manganese transporter [Christensenellales bacterium]